MGPVKALVKSILFGPAGVCWLALPAVCMLPFRGSTVMARSQTQTKPAVAAPARDPNIAVQEELDIARQAGTVAAYDFFIARHPNHALAQVARKERAEAAK